MKLLELIGMLQAIEARRSGMEAAFQNAENTGGNSFATSPLIILDVRAENGQGHCLITLGMMQEDIEKYKEFLEIRAEQMRRQ
jgi:hypothetical protein